MFPLLTGFTFLSIGFLGMALATALIVRGSLAQRLGSRALLPVALLLGVVAASSAAALGLVPWFGPWIITSFALCLVAGAISARFLAKQVTLPRAGLDGNHADVLLITALVGGMLGARARFVWENWSRFRSDQGIAWREILDLDQGGMVWYGGLMVGALAVAGIAWRRRMPLPDLADALSAPLALGLAFGRLGCFLNGCCYGRACDLPWGVTFPHLDDGPRHPTQIYESLAALALAGGCLWLLRRPHHRGQVAACFAIGYGLWRFFNESLRDDYRHAGTLNELGGWVLTNSQITSIWLLVLGLGLATWARVRSSPAPRPPSPGD